MKKLSFLFAMFLVSLSFDACQNAPNDPAGDPPAQSPLEITISPCDLATRISVSDLPAAAVTYLQDNYPNNTISQAYEYSLGNGTFAYGVELSDDRELLFDQAGLLVSSGTDDDDEYLSIDNLPTTTLAYLDANYPNWRNATFQIQWENEYGVNFFEVELGGVFEIYFSLDGQWLCNDDDHGNDNGDDDNGDDDNGDDDNGDDDNGDDDNGDDDNGNNQNCPTADLLAIVTPGLNLLFNQYTIDEIECEDWCEDNPRLIEVDLEQVEDDFFFSLEGEYLFRADDIRANQLPAAVVGTLNGQFPNLNLDEEDDDIDLMTFPNGDTAYRLRFRPSPNGGSRVKMIIAADGSILCLNP
jgi:hypothetical protein